MKANCSNCYHNCNYKVVNQCDDYYPINALDDDDYVDELIESGRQEYYEEWQEYISEYNN